MLGFIVEKVYVIVDICECWIFDLWLFVFVVLLWGLFRKLGFCCCVDIYLMLVD